jgi:3-phosphoshikimate 1-carboxyvinyltransferase
MTELLTELSTELCFVSAKAQAIKGSIRVPGDKSISHRSVIFSVLADGVSNIEGLLEGEDVLATLAAFRAMGVRAEGPVDGKLVVYGVGMQGLNAPASALDMGNSGTAMRLMSGLLAAQPFNSVLIGDESLSKRPMRRIIDPLELMQANCRAESDGTPPIEIRASKQLKGIHYDLPVASAQVKSAILLAGMYANGTTTVVEPAATRDHTERMLNAYGYACSAAQGVISLTGGGKLNAQDISIPADISSASFFMVLASIIPDADLLLEHVGVNSTRVGVINILRLMGADIELLNQGEAGGEPVADIQVRYTGLTAVDVPPEQVPLAIDEFPVLCIAAACAKGVTRIRGAEELRHKESDRISAMIEGLRAIGVKVEEYPDGMDIEGGNIQGGQVDSQLDHRIAMAFAVAGAVAENPIKIMRCENVATSFPNFIELANQVGMRLSRNHSSSGGGD